MAEGPLQFGKVVAELYALEHRQFARRLGLLGGTQEFVTDEVLRGAITVLDDLTMSREGVDAVSAIVALLWEYASSDQRLLIRSFLVLALTRVGLSPSTFLVDGQIVDDAGEDRRVYSEASLREEIAITLLQADSEIRVGSETFLLSSFQKRLLATIEVAPLVCVSAPTSAGKSFALNLGIARYAHAAQLPVVYVVPTISLVNQVTADIRAVMRKQGLVDWKVSTSGQNIENRHIYVLTQERAIGIFAEGGYSGRIGMLLIDEVQNLERVGHEGELRSKILFDFMRDARSYADKIVICGPRLDEIGMTGESVFDIEAVELDTRVSPVANITYSVNRRGGVAFLTQYRSILRDEVSLRLSDASIVQGQGQSRYTDAFFSYLGHLIESLGDESRNIIFSPTSDQARKTANALAGFSSPGDGAGARSALAKFLGEYVHPEYELVSCVARGVAFHSGKVPPHARLAIEQAFTAGHLKDVACTTTLMQGVNLPATVVLIRNPRLAINQRSGSEGAAALSAYDFANLRGRAGRLSKDFIGRTVALDEESFVTTVQEDLFSDGRKSLRPGYGELFGSVRERVISELGSPQSGSTGTEKFLAGYIRQAIVRHGGDAGAHLASIGISLSLGELSEARAVVEDIRLDRGILMAHRYWDPVDLQYLSDTFYASSIKLPTEVWGRRLAEDLADALNFMATTMPYYYERHLGDRSSGAAISSLARAAQGWCREISLRSMIDASHFSRDEAGQKINDKMGLIFKEVSFGLPALLRPLYSVADINGGFLTSIEAGAYNPVTFWLMSLGLYREIAVSMRLMFAPEIYDLNESAKLEILSRIARGSSSLNTWLRMQVAPIFEHLEV
ncbi:DEAD/DEAH box helicase [Luteibacter pinisoli]|uniref:DEAD/DEAH box helicase n=1 Tax=Luteibacter pinisoli TaxID=2589080 RepID=A0A4Y5Z7R9_9GAMM|nr:DEAD/DEAH box helicase [Luteibacter pinisoli]QDE40375.1 DEAD/DEAH box helicase [Luteibacter pinisoli]